MLYYVHKLDAKFLCLRSVSFLSFFSWKQPAAKTGKSESQQWSYEKQDENSDLKKKK